MQPGKDCHGAAVGCLEALMKRMYVDNLMAHPVYTERCKIVKNRNPNRMSELPTARGRHFPQPFTNNFALESTLVAHVPRVSRCLCTMEKNAMRNVGLRRVSNEWVSWPLIRGLQGRLGMSVLNSPSCYYFVVFPDTWLEYCVSVFNWTFSNGRIVKEGGQLDKSW